MTSKENVKRAIHFGTPEYTPVLIYGQSMIDKSDIVYLPVETMFGGDNGYTAEWGFEWFENDTDFQLGQIKRPAIESYDELGCYKAFEVDRPGRFDEMRRLKAEYPDKYFMADFVLSGFTIMLFVRGFDKLMMDFYLEPENVDRLADVIFSKEEELIRACAKEGFDAISLADDWGTQRALLASPEIFKSVFKPRMKSQIDLAHSLGMDVFMHSCGYIIDIIPDLIEIGLDVLNPGQPSLNGIEEMGRRFKGQICFACPVGYQTTAISEDPVAIEKEIQAYLDCFGSKEGGFYGLAAQRLMELGVSEETQKLVTKLWLKYCGRKS